MYTEWTPEMSVGIGDIDVQHRKMIRKINEISEAVDASKSKEEITEAIKFFEVYSEVNNPTASCGALGEKEPPHKITDEAAFIPPAS